MDGWEGGGWWVGAGQLGKEGKQEGQRWSGGVRRSLLSWQDAMYGVKVQQGQHEAMLVGATDMGGRGRIQLVRTAGYPLNPPWSPPTNKQTPQVRQDTLINCSVDPYLLLLC